ncbi:lectin-like protein [Ruminococcus sp.]|uniref:lectin-like protein n=1 Tax=Ruminococcus sp. TaxID=41978 RepID=UPI002EB8EEB9|nr:lectin-like protein [Ruminococcus sp.]
MNPYKQCPNCGRQFPVTDIFCDNCGCQLDLIAPEQAQPPQQPFVLPTQQPPAQATTVYAEKPKKTGVLIGLLVAILLVLAAMIVLGFFLIHQLNQNNMTNHTSELAAVAQTETAVSAAETDAPETEKETVVSVVTVIEQVTVPQTDSPSVYAVPTPEPDPQPAGKTYQAFVDACTWADAKQKCEAAGGHLAYITSDEDWNQAISVLSGTGLRYVWLGGSTYISRDGSTITASWLNGSNLNYIDNANHWYPNEPSGWDNSSPEHSLEPYILLWYVDDYWSLNDTSNDILKYYKPERIGYLCEFD